MSYTVALCFLANGKMHQRWDLWAEYENDNRFTIYIHNSRNWTRHQASYNTRSPKRVPTVYPGVEMVDAEGELYRISLEEKSNSWFIFLSDTTVPLVTPSDLYARFSEISDATDGELGLMGIFETQNDNPAITYLSPFIGEFKDVLDTLAKVYNIPREEDLGIIALLPSKVLTRTGAEEFVKMIDDVAFMKLFEKEIHYPPETVMHTGDQNILMPFSTPDEGCFTIWCNHLGLRQQCVFVIENFTYFDYDDEKEVIVTMKDLSLTADATLCDKDSWFARKVTRHTKTSAGHGVCQRNRAPLTGLNVVYNISPNISGKMFRIGECPDQFSLTGERRCTQVCTHPDNGSEKCADLTSARYIYVDSRLNRKLLRAGRIIPIRSSKHPKNYTKTRHWTKSSST